MTNKSKKTNSLAGKKQSPEHILARVESRKRNGTYIGLKGKDNPMFGKPAWNKAQKGLQKHSAETRKLQSDLKKGKKQTPEQIKKAIEGRLKAAKLRGYYFPPETCKLLSQIHSGKYVSLETRTKQSASWNYDKHVTPQSRERQRLARLNQVFPTRNSKPERMMQLALSLHNIKFVTHKAILGQPDIFIEPNICIFVDGDYPHANPLKYGPSDLIYAKPAYEKWARDSYITHELSQLGYHVIRIWASVIEQDANICAENIIKSIKIPFYVVANRSL